MRALHIPLFRLASDLFDVVAWHVFLLFFSQCLSFPPRGGEKGQQETPTRLHQYVGGNWEALQEEHTTRTFTLTFHKCSNLILNLIPPS